MSRTTKAPSATEAQASQNAASWAGMALDVIGKICRQFEVSSLQPQLEACAEVLGDGDIVDVAVVGRFKASKSVLLRLADCRAQCICLPF